MSCEKLLDLLPPELRASYAPLLLESDEATARIVKAADKLSAHIKCIEEQKAGNQEFDAAARQTGRTGADITLVAATKMNDAARVREAVAAGIDACGETACRR